MHDSAVVYSASLSALQNTTVDITVSATPCKYRLIDCAQFLDHDTLAIHEFQDLPAREYATISYVWRGLGVDSNHTSGEKYGTFTIRGATNGDPMSIDVLRHACTAAAQKEAKFIWLDGLCILQSNDNDKAWQIRRMYHIYQSSALCIVLPGGMRRLAQVDEETTWIQRSWTLQEVLAPKMSNVMVLFAWTYGEALSIASTSAQFNYKEVVPGQSAACPLQDALSTHSGNIYELKTERKTFKFFSTTLFGREKSYVSTLLAVLDNGGLENAGSVQAVWQCSLMRTCTYPVDAVFSIMGLFGVSLDPLRFKPDDRRGATIALAAEILRNGGRADWLAAALDLPPEKGVSALPALPRVNPIGNATLVTEEGERPVAEILPWVGFGWVDGIPLGKMDEKGCFTFSSPAALLIPAGRQESGRIENDEKTMHDATGKLQVIATNGTIWKIHIGDEETYQQTRRSFIAFIGTLTHYTSAVFGCFVDPHPHRAILVEEHEDGRFHRTSSFILGTEFVPYIERCKSYEICLAGLV
ncbi:uncharacterized protein FIBRA_01572 [Fibroporia radiculosa]|uniref:Heterokaryon incompatibility domain-containing protein n=1 Tax=Fibroporia radiculosa TaxID=599839 RepID=J4H1A2_9APHY|nr:uncharacterized protein FIBRA_01572 [Fibroporia radiculosa]CCL99554.1 predicted protein [Fibroporia radiculosa]